MQTSQGGGQSLSDWQPGVHAPALHSSPGQQSVLDAQVPPSGTQRLLGPASVASTMTLPPQAAQRTARAKERTTGMARDMSAASLHETGAAALPRSEGGPRRYDPVRCMCFAASTSPRSAALTASELPK